MALSRCGCKLELPVRQSPRRAGEVPRTPCSSLGEEVGLEVPPRGASPAAGSQQEHPGREREKAGVALWEKSTIRPTVCWKQLSGPDLNHVSNRANAGHWAFLMETRKSLNCLCALSAYSTAGTSLYFIMSRHLKWSRKGTVMIINNNFIPTYFAKCPEYKTKLSCECITQTQSFYNALKRKVLAQWILSTETVKLGDSNIA